MANKIKYGISEVHYAIMDPSDGSYGAVKAFPGAVSISFAPQGERNVFYADNIEYWVNNTNNGYQGDLEVAMLLDAVRADILGESLDNTDKVLTEVSSGADAIRFALGFDVQGDDKVTRFWFFNCTAARANTNANTKEESIAPQTDTLTITAAPLASSGIVRSKTTDDTPTATVEGWYTAVYAPTV